MESLDDAGFSPIPSTGMPIVSAGLPILSDDNAALQIRSQLASPLTMTFDPNVILLQQQQQRLLLQQQLGTNMAEPLHGQNVVVFNDVVSVKT